MTIFERVQQIIARARPYRFPGEQANHEQQARETEVSLGLMADAAEKSDDDSMLHVLGSEAAHRARLARLNALDRELGGLTPTQQGERQSIIKALGELQERREALSGAPTEAPRRFAFIAPVMAANPILAALMTPWTLVVLGLALVGVQTARLNHAKADLSRVREVAQQNYDAAQRWQERSEEYREGLIDAANVARVAAQSLTAERAAQARAAARERRRNREIANVLANSPEPPAWRLRDDEPAAESGNTNTTP